LNQLSQFRQRLHMGRVLRFATVSLRVLTTPPPPILTTHNPNWPEPSRSSVDGSTPKTSAS